ncbi:MAG: hypothetical protein FWF81_15310 [Defluviitaleaceae bacterium]|nr:hypothetical protein [Defluviitaleaceae bacterium]
MKNLKRIAALLILLLMAGAVTVFADEPNPGPPNNDRPLMQNPVADPNVMFMGRGAGNVYNLNIRWTRPHESTNGASTNVLDSELHLFVPDLWTLFPVRYRVRFRNATTNEIFGANPLLPTIEISESGGQPLSQTRGPAPINGVSLGSRPFTMRPSSLYEIEIEPIRFNPWWDFREDLATGLPIQERSQRLAPIDANSPQPRRDLIFMTDIEVRAEGRGNTITIEWDNPTWGGVTLFTHWEVAFQPYERGQPINVAGNVFPVVTSVTMPGQQIQQNADGTLSISITHPTIRPIGLYAVRVEPMLGYNLGNQNHRIRSRADAGAYIPFNIGDRHFNLAFTPQSEVEYRADVMMIPELHIEQLGVDFIRLWWSNLGGLTGGGEGFQIQRVYLEEWPPEMDGQVPPSGAQPLRPPEILGGPGFLTQISEWLIGPGIPRVRRGFALAIRMTDGTIHRTNVVVYDPLEVDFSPYRPDIINISHVGDGRIALEWLAFARYPAVFEERELLPEGDPFNGRFVDTALYYEIFISDQWGVLTSLTTPLKTRLPIQLQEGVRLNPVEPAPLEPQWDPTFALFNPADLISQYQTVTPEGIVTRPIQGNRVYFVRIRAVRDPGGQTSEWAYGSVYIPPLDGLPVRPEMIGAPPVRVDHENVTASSIPIFWDVRFLEMMQINPQQDWAPDRDVWHTVVGVDRRGEIIYGRSAAYINYVVGTNAVDPGAEARHRILNELIGEHNLRNRLLGIGPAGIPLDQQLSPSLVGPFLTESATHVGAFLQGLGAPATPPPVLRIQDMVTFRYQIHVVTYDAMAEAGGLEAYRDGGDGVLGINANPAAWTSIGSPEITNGVVNFTVSGLQENVAYVIFVRPYVVRGGEILHALYPTFVVGTTVTVPNRPTPDPTTPVLFEVPRYTTRNRIGVRWRVQADMIYEIRISHFFTDYPDGGTIIPIGFEAVTAAINGYTVELEDPRAILDVLEVNGVPYFHLRIHERFPDTNYYIWARAAGVNEAGIQATPPSAPSNPVDIRTLDIEPPPPPRAFSRAPQTLITMFNRYNDTEYSADEPYALTLSWMRIFADMRDDMGNLTERAEAGAGDANIRPLNLPNLDATEAYTAIHLLRFEELVANARYYARARTILTVQRNGPDVYTYEIELADNDEFLDSVTFFIPPLIAMDPINTRRAMSEWVTIEIDTGVSDDEFDGVHRPDQYPLPERDWEITYDPGTQTLRWRFRTNQRGEDGRLDQNVDQRFISRIIQSRTFVYTIDLSEFGDMPIANREIIIPESIMRAFYNRRITLEILAGEKNIIIPPGALDTAQMRELQPGIGTYYTITLGANNRNLPPLVTNTEFATVPQRFQVTAATPRRTATLTTFARPVQIVLPVEDHITPDGLRTGLFINDLQTATWRDTNGDFNFADRTLTAEMQTPSTFAGITRNAPPTAENNHPANAPMQRVSSRLTITDMVTFDPNRYVTANEFNNIVNALISGRTSVALGAPIPASAIQSLTRSRMLAPTDLTREAALDIMVRLYENRTRQILTPMTSAASVPGMQNATPALTRNLRIAADLGFITGPLEPQGRLTMGELMSMVDIIILDADM